MGQCQKWSGRPDLVAHLVRVLSPYTKAEGSVSSQGTYKNQPMSAWSSGTANHCFSLSKINTFNLKKEMFRGQARAGPFLCPCSASLACQWGAEP